MTINYIELARKNREKALAGLKHRRGQVLALPGYETHLKISRRGPAPVFKTSRMPALFRQATLH